MLGFVGTRKQKPLPHLADSLPWCGLIAPGILLNKDGALLRSFAYRGPDLEAATMATLRSKAARVNNLLKRFGSGWGLYIEAQRWEAPGYPEGKNGSARAQAIDAERRHYFTSKGHHFESRYFFTTCYLPPLETQQRVAQYLFEHMPDVEQGATGYLTFFQNQTNRCWDMLKDAMDWAQPLDDPGLVTYLYSTVANTTCPVKVPDMSCYYLDWLLSTPNLLGGMYPMINDQHIRTVTFRGFPNASYPGILDALNHLGLEYRWVTRYLPLDKVDAQAVLKAYAKQMGAHRKSLFQKLMEHFGVMTPPEEEDIEAQQQQKDAVAAQEELAEDVISYGYFTATVTVWDANPVTAEEKIHLVERTINGEGFTTHYETLNAVEAWLGSLPGNCAYNVRRPVLHSLNLAHLMPFSASWAGPERDEHLRAPVVMIAEAAGQTPFRISMHERGVGHTLIVGPTGSGKSTYLALEASQFSCRYGGEVDLIDKKLDLLPVTQSHDGMHYRIAMDPQQPTFQPLRQCDDEAERRWLASWVAAIMELQRLPIVPTLRQEIWRALGRLAESPLAERTMSGLMYLFASQELQQALEPFTLHGAYGDLDGSEEAIVEHPWRCFELGTLFELPELLEPELLYLFHVLKRGFTGVPKLLGLDEAWRYFKHPRMLDMVEEWIRELRSKNVSVIFSTQSVATITTNPLAPLILESCPIKIFLPNEEAANPGIAPHYAAMGLNERQIDMLTTMTPRRQYMYHSAQGVRVFELALGPVAKQHLTGAIG